MVYFYILIMFDSLLNSKYFCLNESDRLSGKFPISWYTFCYLSFNLTDEISVNNWARQKTWTYNEIRYDRVRQFY